MRGRDILALGLLAACVVALTQGVQQKREMRAKESTPEKPVIRKKEKRPAAEVALAAPEAKAARKAPAFETAKIAYVKKEAPAKRPPKMRGSLRDADTFESPTGEPEIDFRDLDVDPNTAGYISLAACVGDPYAKRIFANRPFSSMSEVMSLAENAEERELARIWLRLKSE